MSAQVVQGGKEFITAAKIPFIVFESGRMQKETLNRMLSFFRGLGYVKHPWRFSDTPSTDDDHIPENIYLKLVGK